MIEASFEGCRRDLLRPGAAGSERALSEWQLNPLYRDVVPFAENFTHRYLYELGENSVRDVIQHSRHALGDVKSKEQVRFIKDFHAPFALQHLFQWYVEKHRSLPVELH